MSTTEGGMYHTVTDSSPVQKHSSGDLHSRLKARKLLGVGETDDGDIHRSKLSQILGHSDHLNIRLPQGLRLWQSVTGAVLSGLGLLALLLPSYLIPLNAETTRTTETSAETLAASPTVAVKTVPDIVYLYIRLYGGALFGLAIVFWSTIKSQDRDVIRMSFLATAVYFIIHVIVTSLSSHSLSLLSLTPVTSLVLVVEVLGCLYFYIVLTKDARHYR